MTRKQLYIVVAVLYVLVFALLMWDESGPQKGEVVHLVLHDARDPGIGGGGDG